MRRVVLLAAIVLSQLGTQALAAPVPPAPPPPPPPPVDLVISDSKPVARYNAVANFDPLTGKVHLFGVNRLVEQTSQALSWTAGVTPVDATPAVPAGIYHATWDQGASTAPLVVSTSPYARRSDTVVIVPDYTWQAYSDTGGGSFYAGNIDPVRTNRTVNLDRPLHFALSGTLPSDDYATPLMPYANPIRFLTNELGPVDVVAQSALDSLPYDLSQYKLVVLYGHDEYWTATLRAKIESAVSSGTSLLNMSGNTGYRKLVRTDRVLGFEPEGTIWGANPADARVSELTGATYMGYSLEVALQRSHSRMRAPLMARLRRNGFPKAIPYRKIVAYSSGMRPRAGSNPLLVGVTPGRGGFIGVASKAVDIEVDGLPLDRFGRSTGTWDSAGDPTRTSVSADAWVGNRGLRVGVIVQHIFGSGRVVTIGTIGWAAALVAADPNVETITRNAARLLLATQQSAIAGYQWSAAPALSQGSAVVGYVTMRTQAHASAEARCSVAGNPGMPVWCSVDVSPTGTVSIRIPSGQSVDARVTVAVLPGANWILAQATSQVSTTVRVSGS